MKTQEFENSRKSVFGRTLLLVMSMKDSKRRLIPTCSKFSDLRALLNRRHFGSLPCSLPFEQNSVFCKLIIIVYFNYDLGTGPN